MVFLKENQSYSDNPFSSASSGSYVDGELSDISPSDMTAQIHNEDEGESKTYYIKSLLPSLRRIELSQQLNSQPTSYGYTISTTPKPTSSSDGGGDSGLPGDTSLSDDSGTDRTNRKDASDAGSINTSDSALSSMHNSDSDYTRYKTIKKCLYYDRYCLGSSRKKNT